MKTTVEISDALPESAKALAAARSATLRSLIEEGLLSVVESASRKPPYKMTDRSFGGTAKKTPMPWKKIRAIVSEGRGA